MSASREKKQRQGGTPTDKTLTEKQQADQTRRKTIQYTVIGVVVAVLVAALLIWNSGFFQARSTAVTVGGTNYTVAQTSYFYHSTRNYRMMTNSDYASYFGYNPNLSPADQTYTTDEETGEVTTFHDFFLEDAMSQMTTITALYDEAVKNGVTAADVKDLLDQNVAAAKEYASQSGMSYKQYLAAMYGSTVTPSVFEDCVTRALMASKCQEDYQDSLEYSAQQLQDYYEEHKDELDSFQYGYLTFVPDEVETKDADGNDIEMSDEEKTAAEEENLAAAKQKADDAKAALEDGESLDDVISSSEPTSYNKDVTNEGSGLSNAPYGEWLTSADRKAGDVEVVENGSNGYYVVVFTDRFLDETPTVDTRHILVRAEQTEGAAPTDEQMAAAKTKAEDLLSQWQTGAATEDSFAELANTNSDDGGSNTNGGLYENVYKGQFVTNYNDWLFDDARQPGDTGVVENQGDYYGYHVVYYVKQNPDTFKWMVEAQDALTSDDANSWVEGLQSSYTAEQAGGAKYLA